MKRTVLFAALLCIALYSCTKAEITDPSPTQVNPVNNNGIAAHVASVRNNPDSEFIPTVKTVNLLGKKTIDEGDITVTNDGENVFVKITMQNGYLLKKSSIYVGTMANAPLKHDGHLDEGHFPYRKDQPAHGVTSYTLTVPANSLPDCFIIIVKADTHNGPSNKAWAEGQDFPGSNKATYFEYCKYSANPNI